MKLGLIGHPLGHSWSPEIHHCLIGEAYEKWDLSEQQLKAFMAEKDFDGINVTIPYKQEVMQYLDDVNTDAEDIGAVNTIVNRHGKLIGYNTDCIGFRTMVESHHIDLYGKRTAVLGSGGASKAVVQALHQLGAVIHIVSRNAKEGCMTYEQLYQDAASYQCIVNTTPVGMYPHTEEQPIELDSFTSLEALIDIVANPLCTSLRFDAKTRGIVTCGGLEMLVRQAFAADELFLDQKLDESLNQKCLDHLYHTRRNIVLIGMPTSGKTTLTKMLGERTGHPVYEMDEEIEKRIGMPIKQCFAEKGETYFREQEHEEVIRLKSNEGSIISCGGGIIKRSDNMKALSENGLIIWIQRDVDYLFATDTRPLTGDEEYMKQLYQERKGLYQKYADVTIQNNTSIENALHEILKIIGEE